MSHAWSDLLLLMWILLNLNIILSWLVEINVMEVVRSFSINTCSKRDKKHNVKVFNMITNKNEAKKMTKRISCDCKCKFNSKTCNSNQKWNRKTCQCECRNDRDCIRDYSWNPNTCICENGKYLKYIADISVIACDEIISVITKRITRSENIVYFKQCFRFWLFFVCYKVVYSKS